MPTWLAESVKKHRGQQSLRDLGEELGVSAATIQRVEDGRNCSVPVYHKLCAWITEKARPRIEDGTMSAKRTMTLNLTEEEMVVLEGLSAQKDMSKTAVMRQALRLYQLVDVRLSRGERLFVEDRQKKAELILLCCANPLPITEDNC